MARYKLTIEYAGTRYSGWQIQQNARTIQGELDRAIRTVTTRKDFELYGSGRTDAGVHATGQVAHLDIATSLPPDTLRQRVNDELPSDINILAAEKVSHRFHARHDAEARRYVYQIARRRTAFVKNYVWWIKDPLDVARMTRAAGSFVGLRDFASFAESDDKAAGAPRSTKVLVDRVSIVEDGDLVLVVVEGSHFLWKMVRRIVGVLAAIGRGELAERDAARLLDVGHDTALSPARLTAPASGLFLARVYYPGDRRDDPVAAVIPVPGTSRTTRSEPPTASD
jgi:tRNA pseudouridine38-40 synthase